MKNKMLTTKKSGDMVLVLDEFVVLAHFSFKPSNEAPSQALQKFPTEPLSRLCKE
jgi:hypothetical protein